MTKGPLRTACVANGLTPPVDGDDDAPVEEWLRGLADAVPDSAMREEAHLQLDAAIASARAREVVRAATQIAMFRRALRLGGGGLP